jgi:hypothetical protein
MTKDEALDLVLETLERMNHAGSIFAGEFDKELAAIKQALAAPVQEPVLWLVNGVVQASDIPTNYTGCFYTTPPAQPAPVQPAACQVCGGSGFIKCDALQSREKNNGKWGRCLNCQPYTTPPAAPVLEGRDWSLLEATQESLREHMAEIKRLKKAQPAVPDAIGPNEDELPAYAAGWNDCRAEMLKGMKP